MDQIITLKNPNLDQIITFKNPKLGPDNNFTAYIYIYIEREVEREVDVERQRAREGGFCFQAAHTGTDLGRLTTPPPPT